MCSIRWALLRVLGPLLVPFVCAMLAGSAGSARAASEHPLCQEATIPVRLAPGATQTFEVAATLCRDPAPDRAERSVQLLVHGITASRVYWDLPRQRMKYSYVVRATHAGLATLNLERIGIGASDHPPVEQVDLDSNVFVVHQVIQALRAGAIGGTEFEKVVLVGHSFGSVIGGELAGRFPGDLDGLILTGALHTVNPELPSVLANAFLPAELDPRFADAGLPPGYLTSVEGLQPQFLVNRDRVDLPIVEFHESLKETVTPGELASPSLLTAATTALDIPVLLLVGELDRITCGTVDCADLQAVAASERPFFANTCLEIQSARHAGHLLTLQRNSQQYYSQMLEWTARTIASGPGPRTDRCR
jgi:pimeloyl-ACP methyl ester carboxylesterase